MRPELERASRALVTLASAALVSWWLWPRVSDVLPAPRLEPPPVALSEVVPVTPVVPDVELESPTPIPALEPPARAVEAPAPTSAPRQLPTITATARREEPRGLALDKPARPRGDLSEGRLPKLRASGTDFAAFRDAMLALGGGFFLFDASAKRPLAEIDPITGQIRSEQVRPGLSDWPRDFTRFFEVALTLGQKRYPRASGVVLLPPAGVDITLITALKRELPPLGVDIDAVVRVDLVYALRGGRLECDVIAVGLRDAADRALELRVQLSDPIPGLSYLTSREEIQHA